MEGRREQNKQLCRARILKASRQLFRSKGFDETTMEDVAAGAEVSKATLYNYFASKDSLLLGIAEAALEEIRVLIATQLCEEPDAVEKLRRVMRTFVQDAAQYLALGRKIFYLNSFEQSELHQTRVEMEAILAALVEQARAQGALRAEVSVQTAVEVLMGLYFTALYQWSDADALSGKDVAARVDALFGVMTAGVFLQRGK